MILQGAVEGDLDESVLRRLAAHTGIEVSAVYGKEGKPQLRARIDGYNAAAQWAPWLVIVDLDQDHGCPAELRATWLPNQSQQMCFRVAVRQIESWVMADRSGCASLLGVSQAHLPLDPDAEENAKRSLVQIACKSRWRHIRDGLVPADGSGRSVGPLYNATLREFVLRKWDPEKAANSSQSLCRCLQALRVLPAVCEGAT